MSPATFYGCSLGEAGESTTVAEQRRKINRTVVSQRTERHQRQGLHEHSQRKRIHSKTGSGGLKPEQGHHALLVPRLGPRSIST